MSINLLKSSVPLVIARRSIGNSKAKKQYHWNDEGIKYHGFKYYPRHPETFQDPPYDPTKLFRVQRIKTLKGRPYWEREVLEQFGLGGKASAVAVLKNCPEINAMLWRVKHLISIVPITFPNGFPQSSTGTFLKENGECMVAKEIQPIAVKTEASEMFEKNPIKLDPDTLRRKLRKKWLSGW